MPKSITFQVAMANINNKLGKRYERDIRFMRALLRPSGTMKGIIAEITPKMKLWVPEWDRLITVRPLYNGRLGDKVTLTVYADPTRSSWKNRIIVNWKIDVKEIPVKVTECSSSPPSSTQPKKGFWSSFF